MSDFCSAHGDRMVASNFVEQLGFHSDRIVIEQYRNYQGRLPSLIIRIGWSQEPADPRDLDLLAELEEAYGPAQRNVSDAILEVPAGWLHIQGAYLPQPSEEPIPSQTDLPLEVDEVCAEVESDSHIHPIFRNITRGWKGGIQ